MSALTVLSAAMVLALSGCSSGGKSGGIYGGGGSSGTTTAPAGAPQAKPAGTAAPALLSRLTLVAHNVSWSATTLQVRAGQRVTITLVNKDGFKHNLTVAAAKVDADLAPGATTSASFTLGKAGTYSFHCEYHPKVMKGVIKVV